MKKIGLGILVALLVIGFSGVATAGWIIPLPDSATENAKVSDKSPAVKITEGGLALSPPGLEKVVFIHYKKGYGGFCNNDGICQQDLGENPSCADCKKDKEEPEEPDTSSCYAFLGRGVEWKELPVSYVVHPDLEAVVSGAIFASAETWDDAVSRELFSDSYTLDATANWDSNAPDGRNELSFGDYQQDGVIAVTIIWGYFGGRPSSRRIVEFDIMFDTDFTWGDATIDSMVMDLQNIAVHELGHGAGLADLYDTVCAEETMYGYSDYGEIKKRDLNAGDIIGIQELYGGF